MNRMISDNPIEGLEVSMDDLLLQLPVIDGYVEPEAKQKLTEEALKAKLATGSGKTYWRSLEELADSKEFDEFVHREYPSQTSVLVDPVSRRSFLKLMGASLGLAGLAACTTQPKEEVIPFVKQPEEFVPGKPLFFATAMPMSGGALGLLVRNNDGRPTKIEGNPDHPGSMGATDIFAQAAILGMYDPDRSPTIQHLGDVASWGAFMSAVGGRVGSLSGGAGLYFLSESISSPSVVAMAKQIMQDMPGAKWHQYEPIARGGSFAGNQAALGSQANALYQFDKADRVVSLDSDFMMGSATSVRYARDFSAKRRISKSSTEMSRFYAVETTPTATGVNADNRISVRPAEFEAFVSALASAVGAGGAASATIGNAKQQEFIAAMAKDLLANRGKSIIIPGEWQSPYVHALAHQMNSVLGNIGSTVFFSDPIEMNPVDHMASLSALVADMNQGKVDTLVILGSNPVYSAPADLKFADALKNVKMVVHHGLYNDETAAMSHWHVPEAHFLETWGDARAHDGTVSIIQPLIAPLYEGRSVLEVLSVFTKSPGQTAYELVKNYWIGNAKGAEADRKWKRVLHDGLIPNTSVPLRNSASVSASTSVRPSMTAAQGLDVVFRPDPSIGDGRYANNGWLQELPKPITKLTWDNAAIISPATAKRLGVNSELESRGGDYKADVIEISVNGHKMEAPVWVLPGQPDETITLHLGYGRTRAGRVGTGVGVNANLIRTSQNPWFATGAQVRKVGKTYELAGTQIHFATEGREPVRATSFEEYKKNPEFVREEENEPSKDLSMFPKYEYTGYAWGMSIDLNSCIGCNACIVACVSENNIPVVGKEQVLRSREMHWLRVDRYYTGAAEDPDTYWQPVPCMHCENAPCELVCPVEATSHSAEGLNDMTYNRCVGTRYCSNNCPYKVRRFNFLLYQDWNTPSYKLMRNPEVSVRSRGVMEKCTYCVQRIQNAKIDSEKENRKVRDGEIVTACQGACPTDAITFGDINDPNSRVAKLKSDSRNYSLLGELNTQPRTTYLGAVRNPNPEIKRPVESHSEKERA